MYDGWLTRRYCWSNREGLGFGLWLWILLTISQNWSDNIAYFWPSDILLTISQHTSDHLTYLTISQHTSHCLAYFWPSDILLTISQHTSHCLAYFWPSDILLTISQHTSHCLAYFWPSDILLTISQHTSHCLAYFWPSDILLTISQHTSDRVRKKHLLRRLRPLDHSSIPTYYFWCHTHQNWSEIQKHNKTKNLWSLFCSFFPGITNSSIQCKLSGLRHKFVIYIFVNECSRTCAAILAMVVENCGMCDVCRPWY